MKCQRARDSFLALEGGDLPRATAEQLRRHLANCPACRLAYDQVLATAADLRGLGRELGDHTETWWLGGRLRATLRTAPTPITLRRLLWVGPVDRTARRLRRLAARLRATHP